MPDWAVILLTVVLVGASVLTALTMIQAILNFRAVDKHGGVLERYAKRVMRREITIFVAVLALALIGIVAIIPGTTRVEGLIGTFSTVILAVALSAIALIDYIGMRDRLEDFSKS